MKNVKNRVHGWVLYIPIFVAMFSIEIIKNFRKNKNFQFLTSDADFHIFASKSDIWDKIHDDSPTN